jgi:Cof subfamily protein (haloacid dehalogenase superfamily)
MKDNDMENTSKAIFLDIDGTLILRDKGPFTDDIDMVKEARERGHHIFLSTGRSLANIPPVLRNASYIDGIVAGSGAHVVIDGKTVYRKWIPKELLVLICDYYLNKQKWCIFEGETNIYGINQYDPSLFVGAPLVITEKNDFIIKYKETIITKLTLEGIATDEERMILQDHFKLNSFSDYSEGIIKNETKSHGMEIILEKTGMTKENSIAIGDSVNDLDMISFSGLGIAMGNACDELKQIAKNITLDCGHGGVANAIKRWVL